MKQSIDTEWGSAGFGVNPFPEENHDLSVCRWAFAYLPDKKMKAVAADWMARVLLGADPSDMSAEELHMLSVSTLMALDVRPPGTSGLWCDA
jgi:hypothetical protein